jgi:hypothetical protein
LLFLFCSSGLGTRFSAAPCSVNGSMVVIWTRKWFPVAQVSERKGEFGQEKGIEGKSCPKEAGVIWTGGVSPGQNCQKAGVILTGKGFRGQKLSENRRHSDRKSLTAVKAVRKRAPFGQKKCLQGKNCPKAGAILTGKGYRGQKLSESRHHSDKKSLTGVKSCPKAGTILTRKASQASKLSESERHLDRRSVSRAKVVRKQAPF